MLDTEIIYISTNWENTSHQISWNPFYQMRSHLTNWPLCFLLNWKVFPSKQPNQPLTIGTPRCQCLFFHDLRLAEARCWLEDWLGKGWSRFFWQNQWNQHLSKMMDDFLKTSWTNICPKMMDDFLQMLETRSMNWQLWVVGNFLRCVCVVKT